MRLTLIERLASRVALDDNGCWIWIGYVKPNGYATFTIKPKGTQYVHRVMYELFMGSIPEGLQLDHLCRVRECVNPNHLEPVTQRENILRGVGWCAQKAAATHCAQGHPFDEENTYRYANGHRSCRACNRIWCAERASRKKVTA